MEIIVNGEKRSHPAPLTVAGLLKILGINAKAVVVERNLDIVERGAFENEFLAEGDAIEIVRLVGGG